MERSREPALRPESQPPVVYEARARDRRGDVRLLRATIDLAPIGIAHFDRDGHIVLGNDQLCAMLGRSQEELLGLTFRDLTFPDDLSGSIALGKRLAAGVVPSYRHEVRLLRPDGTTLWTRVTASAVRDDRGEIEFFLALVEDVSEQRASDDARCETEERLRLALDASMTGTFRWQVGTRTLEWDENIERLFGLEPGTAHSEAALFERVHSDDRARLVEAWWLCATEGAELDEQFRIVWPDGSVRWLCDKGRTTTDADGTPLHLAGACTDITARMEAELERERLLELEQRARAEAERAIKLRDEVLGVVVHDLRNPLNTIGMGASTLLDIPLGDAQRRHHLEIIQRTARRMNRLISDLLDVTRIESGTFAIHRLAVPIRALLDQTLELFTRHAEEREITLRGSVAADVTTVPGDDDRLIQLLSNLIGNSLKFTQPGGRIDVHAERIEGRVRISVSDTGCGIPAESLPRLFDRFWQADRASRAGAGLGLAIARGIVEAHGGDIWVESAPGVGTTFYFTLPLDAG